MARFKPASTAYATRVEQSFKAQTVMQTIGGRLETVTPGAVTLVIDHQESLTQQHGFLHAGIVSTMLDSACGYAAFSLMPDEAEVLTVEFKINLLAPARGDRYRFNGTVLKAGRTITISEGRAFALNAGQEKLIASMTGTLMAITGRQDVAPKN